VSRLCHPTGNKLWVDFILQPERQQYVWQVCASTGTFHPFEGYNGPGKPFTPPPAAPDPLAELTTWDLSEIPKIEKKVLDAVHSGNGAKYGIETVRPDQLTDEYTNRVLANVERGADDPEAA